MTKHSAYDVAAWFLNRQDRDSGDVVTHLKLQKLVYYAQAWSLALLGAPLFDEEMEAWAHGPVARSVYEMFSGNGWKPLEPVSDAPEFSAEEESVLTEVNQVYSGYSAKRLEEMTHREQPWMDARGELPPEVRSTATISKETMRNFYARLLEKATESA